MSTEETAVWTGCGDCDCSFPCHNGETRCIRMPLKVFSLGDHVHKIKGAQWRGRVVGFYSTKLTPEGYAVESDTEKGSVQIYPAAALEKTP